MIDINKSTNVRTEIRAPRYLRWGLGALEAVAPPLAARVAEALFLTPGRSSAPAPAQALFARATRLSIPFAGQSLAAWRWGHGPTVLLVHGWAGRAAQLHAFVEPLVDAGYAVVAFDAPAHGASSGRRASLPHLALAVARVADHVGPLYALVAHSMGGAAAAVAIADGLSVERAVLIAPPANALDYYRRFAGALGLSRRVARAAQRRIEERLLVPWRKLSATRLGPRLELPLLVIHDRGDAQVPWTEGAATVEASPAAELVTTEGLGHRRILRDPDVVAQAVAFVAHRGRPADRVQRELDRELFNRDTRWVA